MEQQGATTQVAAPGRERSGWQQRGPILHPLPRGLRLAVDDAGVGRSGQGGAGGGGVGEELVAATCSAGEEACMQRWGGVRACGAGEEMG
jgi:hypothetical protein